MGGVPEINVPTQQAEAMPTPVEPTPPLGAFAGANIGAGLKEIGQKIFDEGWESYHKAMEAHSQQKEVEFQEKALKLRDQYRNMKNMDAIGAHTKYEKELERLRKQIGGTIPSQYGAALYSNNSQRTARFVQESMDSHFETENANFRKLQYSTLQEGDVRLVARLSTDGSYNEKNIEEIIKGMHDRALDWANSNGVHGDLAEKLAINETHKATDALFNNLLDKNANRDPALIQSELKKYSDKGMVDAQRAKDAQHALGGTAVNRFVSQTMALLKPKDFKGAEDPEGLIPHADMVAAREKLDKNDPQYEQKVEALDRAWARHEEDWKRAGAEMQAHVVAKGTTPGRSFAIPIESMEWQKFVRLYPVQSKALDDATSDRQYKVHKRSEMDARDANRLAFAATRYRIDKMSVNEAQKVTTAQVNQWMTESMPKGGGLPSDEYNGRALEFLKRAQTGKKDALEQQFNTISRQVLNEAFKGNKMRVESNMDRAHLFLSETLETATASGKKLTEPELRLALQKAAVQKNGLFGSSFGGSRDIESYEYRPKVPPGWYNVDGRKRHWDGSRYDQ